jgi:3-hydroxybutyryl-CoA dehydrogenase
MEITRIGVVGLGTMGSGILEVVARNGYSVVGVDLTEDGVAKASRRVKESMDRGLARGKLTEEDIASVNGRMSLTTQLAELADCDLVIEAIHEDLDSKRRVFAELDQILAPQAILATNTSALSVTDISVSTGRPSRVLGMHFFNPATVQKFVEIVQTVTTDPAVVEIAREFAVSLSKEPVVVSDRAGFIANALLFGYLNQAVAMYEQKYASREDIDNAMKLGCGLPMGPLALLDLIGLDTSLQILDTMYRQGRDRLHAPNALLKQMVAAGLLGRKSGRGFYTYESGNSPNVVADQFTPAVTASLGSSRFKSVGVIGSGTMATGIASVFASAGVPVTLVTRSPEKSEAALAGLAKSWQKLVDKEKISQETLGKYLANIQTTEAMSTLNVDLVIEAIAEDFDTKAAIFRELDQVLPANVVFATTTSSLSVIELAAQTGRPEKFLGIHFFNPAAIMKLVEMVSTVVSDPVIVAECTDLIQSVGKVPVQCSDRAGFIVNALLFPYLNNAITMATENYATLDDIDSAMKLGCGYPMGPFELIDVVGLDVSLAIITTLYLEFREPGFAPAPRLEHLVTAGYLGRKVGRGFRSIA